MFKQITLNSAMLLWIVPFTSQAENTSLADLPLSSFVDVTSLESLSNMVLTDTKVAQNRNSVTQNIALLQSDEFDLQPNYNRNISELLRYTSGQFVNALSRNDANWGAYAGLGAKYNTYLFDGLPIDSFVDPMSLDPWAIERIEAHKGVAGVMYSNYLSMDFAGNEAPLAGTTNLILKDRIDETKTRLQVGYGSFNTVSGRAYHQGRQGDLSYFAGVSEEQADYAQYGSKDSWLQTTNSPDYGKTKAYGKVRYALGREDHTISLFVHYTRHDGDMGRPNRHFEHDYGTLNFAYNNQLNDILHLQLKAGDRYYNRQFGNDNFPTDLNLNNINNTRQNIIPIDASLSFKHGDDSLLTVGVDHQNVDYQTSIHNTQGIMLENDVNAESLGEYLQEKIQWHDWILRAGVRHNDMNHEYGLLGGKVPAIRSKEWETYLWSAGIRYNVTTTFSLYANAGSGFMAPAAKQIGGTLGSSTDSGQIANAALHPETGIGKDVGLEWQATPSLTLAARAFHNEISSAIIDSVVNVAASQTLATNAGSATAYGVEMDIKHKPWESLQWFANLTLTKTSVENPKQADQNDTSIPFTPEQVANVGINATTFWGISASPYFHWVGQYYDSTSRSDRATFGNYALVNMRLQKELFRQQNTTLNLALDLNNLTDQAYQMPWGFRDVGFNSFAQLDLTF